MRLGSSPMSIILTPTAQRPCQAGSRIMKPPMTVLPHYTAPLDLRLAVYQNARHGPPQTLVATHAAYRRNEAVCLL